MKIMSIASGSSGNCTYIGSGDTHIIVDAGVSRKKIVEGLKSTGVSPDMLSAIFVTHEHVDHIGGVRVMEKNFAIPLYGTDKTLKAVEKKCPGNEIRHELVNPVKPDDTVKIGGISITAYSMSHDAEDPVCYVFEAEGKKMGLATDLGCYSDYTLDHLRGCDCLFLESNHDTAMLETGPYPYELKNRIASEKGHLSNDAAGELLSKLISDRLKAVELIHLSKENNTPDVALQSVKYALWDRLGLNETGFGFSLEAAKRDMPSPAIII